MAEILEWQGVPRPRAVPRFIASALHRGALVALPSESAYLLAASVRTAEGEAYSPRQVEETIGEKIDLIVDGGSGRYRMPSTVVEVQGGSWSLRREGVVSAEELRQQLACLIVFVCTGNTCRSPLAEALCKKHLASGLGCAVEELPGRGYVVL